ncbi:SDR family NAD(P)-dependent oxidoreductase [Pelagibius sp. Alg239-R121]|uniref:SDR family NAD(P)-dependent oxidoreductase n=1 Tax=Pelagibius sp. Alg239-R121 TaxID=2993448 RepID=UPI0024A6CFA4|nr:SDR family NAD(P)-dependent oxidoreductase [Pelagibius sp. Alg239-R121]
MRFTDKTVVVTGAAGNLGQAVAAAFAAEGAQLILVDVDAARLDEVYPGSSARRGKLAVDLRDEAATAAALAEVLPDGRACDVLCAIAGGFHMGEAVHETSAEVWDLMLGLNAQTLLNAVKALVPGMVAQGQGRVVTVGAAAARSGVAGMGAYTATKSVVMRLTEAMAGELAGKGVTVNAVLPSIIDTPQNRAAMPKADPANWVAPADLASVVTFLASAEARAVSGALVPVTGGR